jgi:hypothetical protein
MALILVFALAFAGCKQNDIAGAIDCKGDSLPFQEAWEEVYDYMLQVIDDREAAGCPAISEDWALPECWLRTGPSDGSRQDDFLDCYELPDCATGAAIEMAKNGVIEKECNSFNMAEGVAIEWATEVLGATEKENSNLW